MTKKKSKQTEDRPAQSEENVRERTPDTDDLQDSARDEEHLKSDEAILDLPDVKDIPGQEFIHVPRIGEMADTTISSDDEEGVGIFNNEDELYEGVDSGEMPSTSDVNDQEENVDKNERGRDRKNLNNQERGSSV